MADSLQLEIVTAAAPKIKATIKQIYIPAFEGKAGVLKNHKPYISLLKPGEIFYTDIDNKNHYYYIHDGFMEVKDNEIIIVSDTIEKGEDFDKEEVETKLNELDKKIKASVKLIEGMTEEEMKKLPDDLATALEEKKEFETKQKILQKLSKEKS